MAKIFISAHGKMASGMMSSIELLYGKAKNVTVYDAYVEPEDRLGEQITAFLRSVPEEETKLLLSDIPGGSVNQEMIKFISDQNTYLISGISLPLLLELVLSSDKNFTAEELDSMIERSRKMTKRVECSPSDLGDDDLFV